MTYNQGGILVTRKMDYDAWGNVTWSQQTVQDGSSTKTLTSSYAYDGNNQLASITYPSGRVIEYVRDAAGRIVGIEATFNGTTDSVVFGAQYYPFGPPSGYWYGNGLAHAMVRDTAYSPIWMRLFSSPPLQYFDSRTYDIDDAGDITAIDDLINSGNSRDFGYDDLSRLTWDSRVTATAPTYAYDPNGNRLSRTATAAGFFDQDLTYDADSNVVATYAVGGGSPVPVIHDGMGNVTDNGAGLLFAYDDGGRLNSIWQNATVTGLLTLYNGMGELARTRKVTYDPCTNAEILLMMEYFGFAPDGRALHLRSENYSRTETDWVWLDGDPVAQFQDSYDGLGVYQGTTVTYLHTDHLGTPRVGTDDGQQVTWRLETDAFGIGAPAGPAVVRLRMPGQVAFGLGGVDYNYFRDYWAQWGRYLQSDPIGLDGGLNTYGYVAQNPIAGIDPKGLACNASGCWLTPAEAGLVASGDYLGYYTTACAAGDTYACAAHTVAVNEGLLANLTNWRLRRSLRRSGASDAQCDERMEDIRVDLAREHAAALEGGSQRNPIVLTRQRISEFHNKTFSEYGAGRVFGGDIPVFGNWPFRWCTAPSCRP